MHSVAVVKSTLTTILQQRMNRLHVSGEGPESFQSNATHTCIILLTLKLTEITTKVSIPFFTPFSWTYVWGDLEIHSYSNQLNNTE